MSVDGFISSSALFHDKDGTTTLKVVSLASADSYSSGMVAIASGTCGTSVSTVDFSQYKKPDGTDFDVNYISSVLRLAFTSDNPAKMTTAGNIAAMTVGANRNEVSIVTNPGFSGLVPATPPVVQVAAVSGTANYSVILLGE